jgi:alpha-L-fucosidase 2
MFNMEGTCSFHLQDGYKTANLQGIWNDLLAPPWGSKYTTNINAEMNYWPAESLNLSPLHEPLFKMIDELAEAGKQTAKVHYDAPGWVLHHNTTCGAAQHLSMLQTMAFG